MKKKYIVPTSTIVSLQGKALMDVWSAGVHSDDIVDDPTIIKSRHRNKLWDDDDDDSWRRPANNSGGSFPSRELPPLLFL